MGRIRRRGRIFVSCDQLDADWSVGALGCWFFRTLTPIRHYSITPVFLLRRVSFGHLVEETFERVFYGVPVACDVRARRGESIALYFDSQIRNGEEFYEAALSRRCCR